MMEIDWNFRMKRRREAPHGPPRTRFVREFLILVGTVAVLTFAFFVLGVDPSALLTSLG